jgi:trk system potassium uptake protein TrkH
MRKIAFRVTPITLPIILFAGAIACGTLLLHTRAALAACGLSWIDALFTATSAICVTGLTTVDTGTTYSLFGQAVVALLIQLGGLGIMTYTALIYYLIRQKVALNDRFVIGQGLQHDPRQPFGALLVRIVTWTVIIETCGAIFLYLSGDGGISPFAAVFHSISAFCNAGFSLYHDNLMAWRGNWGVNLVVMILIVTGGLGFAVVVELNGRIAGSLQHFWQQLWHFRLFRHFRYLRYLRYLSHLRRPRRGPVPTPAAPRRLSWYSKIVLMTTFFLIVGGGIGIYLCESCAARAAGGPEFTMLAGFFQSITCRTAGFNTVDIRMMTNASLYLMMFLMFVGGGSGSCAGGLKVGTFRVLIAFLTAQIRGRSQAVIGRFAVAEKVVHEALVLLFVSVVIILSAAFILNITEGGLVPHPMSRDLELKILFETVSAYGTVGLSLGLTTTLSTLGKLIVILLMFTGRLGPIVLIAAVQSYQRKELFRWPEERLLVG